MKKHRTVATLTGEPHSLRVLHFGAAFIVLIVQLILPIAPVFANEIAGAGASTEEVTTHTQDTEETAPSLQTATDQEEDTTVIEEDVLVEEGDTEETDPPLQTAIDSEEGMTVIEEETAAITGTNDTASTEEASDELSPIEEPVEAPSDSPSENEEVPPPLPEVTLPLEEELPTDIAASSSLPDSEDILQPEIEEVVEEESIPSSEEATSTIETGETHTITNNENRFTFGVDDCAQVADGSFYCTKKEILPAISDTDRVFAGPDADGDSEIFIERQGELIQITHNTKEDNAPYYDAVSNTIVWHRLVSERYQIISYDIKESKETTLTHDHFNNMQPTRTGEATVWQGWVGNDWEILLMEDEEVTMITDNTVHDIGPRINGEYVIWQSEEAEGWKVRVYNRITKEIETISDAEGASIENPRLVLLYDAKSENGDVETRGYDLLSGETVPLHAGRGTAPENIPDPEQTGEDRALITTTTQLKTKTEDDGESLGDATSTPIIPSTDGTEDIVVPSLEDTNNATSTPVSDLIIPPLLSEEPVVVIEDLVIPTYDSEDVTEVDSQEEVAS